MNTTQYNNTQNIIILILGASLILLIIMKYEISIITTIIGILGGTLLPKINNNITTEEAINTLEQDPNIILNTKTEIIQDELVEEAA